jgi:hypothetical protein
LQGELDVVLKLAGAFGVDARGAEGVGDHGEGEQDGVAVFKEGQVEVVHGLDFGPGLEDVKAGMAVAKGLAFEGDGFTLGSAGQDVATFVRDGFHGWTFPRTDDR